MPSDLQKLQVVFARCFVWFKKDVSSERGGQQSIICATFQLRSPHSALRFPSTAAHTTRSNNTEINNTAVHSAFRASLFIAKFTYANL
jgi:hypothetical protein